MRGVTASLFLVLLAGCASPGVIQRSDILNVEPLTESGCIVTYSDGDRRPASCPNDWPPAGDTLRINCSCQELVSSEYLCEARYSPFALGSRFDYMPIGSAGLPRTVAHHADIVRFACTQGARCAVKVKVTSPWGAHGSAVCAVDQLAQLWPH